MNVYLDNAATTPMLPEVIEAMLPYMRDHFGNPSSTHQFGRRTKTAIEQSRRQIAEYLGVDPADIGSYFSEFLFAPFLHRDGPLRLSISFNHRCIHAWLGFKVSRG